MYGKFITLHTLLSYTVIFLSSIREVFRRMAEDLTLLSASQLGLGFEAEEQVQ